MSEEERLERVEAARKELHIIRAMPQHIHRHQQPHDISVIRWCFGVGSPSQHVAQFRAGERARAYLTPGRDESGRNVIEGVVFTTLHQPGGAMGGYWG